MTRRLVLVLGDQLSHASPALAGLEAGADAVLMIEAPGEATHVWSHRARIAIFLSAMRHFRDELRARGVEVHYVDLEQAGEDDAFEARLAAALRRLAPEALALVEPGEWRLQESIATVANAAGIALEVHADAHFLCSRAEFAAWAEAHGTPLLMEAFYRHVRTTHRVLVEADGEPAGGRWNFDAANRRAWPKSPAGRAGPGLIAEPERIEPDAITREVIALVERRFGGHPGSLEHFGWPVCRADALRALDVFIGSRLHSFGDFQDAMWTRTPFGWHSLLSCALNLKLLDPREAIGAAEAAYRRGDVPLASAEGYIRQVLGWREFIRGNYWRDMPGMAGANALDARRPLPRWYWTGKTRMSCTREVVRQTLAYGFAHHVQRLMVTGLFALLAGVEPRQVADWYLAVYVDAVEWVELPNVAGMALWADGGRFTTKPYVASGAYILRMSNYCASCAYAPTDELVARSGKPLCPMTTLYWDFVDRHAARLRTNRRTFFMVEHLERRPPAERAALKERAAAMLADLDAL